MRRWRGCSRHTRNGLSGRVDAAPPAESPRQIPSRAGRSCEGHVVDPRSAPGLAAQQSRQGHPSSAPQPETFDRLVGVDRTSRQVPAVVANQRRQGMAVNPDQSPSRIARQALHRPGAVGAAERMLNGRCAIFMGVDLRGSPAWNPPSQIFASHFGEYRMFWVALQQRFYGR
jgi:hypothetical protein